MWSIRCANHLFVYWNGELVYKRWYAANGVDKAQDSILFNHPWPVAWIRSAGEVGTQQTANLP